METSVIGGICAAVGALVGVGGLHLTRTRAATDDRQKAREEGKAEGIMEAGFSSLQQAIANLRSELATDRAEHRGSLAKVKEELDQVASLARATDAGLRILSTEYQGFRERCDTRHELPTGQHEAYPSRDPRIERDGGRKG